MTKARWWGVCGGSWIAFGACSLHYGSDGPFGSYLMIWCGAMLLGGAVAR